MKNKFLIMIVMVIILVASLLACTSSISKESAIRKLEAAGYTVTISEGAAGGMNWTLSARNDTDHIMVYHFNDSNARKFFYESLKNSGVCEQIGEMVVIGTKDAIEVLKKID